MLFHSFHCSFFKISINSNLLWGTSKLTFLKKIKNKTQHPTTMQKGMEYPECSVMWWRIWGLLWLCVIQCCWLSGISIVNIPPLMRIVCDPLIVPDCLWHFSAAAVYWWLAATFSPILRCLFYLCMPRLNVSCSRCFFSFFFFLSFGWRNSVCPTLWSEVLHSVISCQSASSERKRFFSFLLWKHRGCCSSSSSPPTLALWLLLCDVLTTNGYILKENSISWCYQPTHTQCSMCVEYSVLWANINTFQ